MSPAHGHNTTVRISCLVHPQRLISSQYRQFGLDYIQGCPTMSSPLPIPSGICMPITQLTMACHRDQHSMPQHTLQSHSCSPPGPLQILRPQHQWLRGKAHGCVGLPPEVKYTVMNVPLYTVRYSGTIIVFPSMVTRGMSIDGQEDCDAGPT